MSNAVVPPLPNLYDRYGLVRTQMGGLVGRRKEKAEAERFEDRARQVKAPALALENAAAHGKVLKDAGVAVEGVDGDAVARWRNRLNGLLESFQLSPTSILDPSPGEDVRRVLFEPLRQVAATLDGALQNSWQTWVDEQVPQISADLLQVLGAVPALSSAVSVVRSAQSELRLMAARLPSDVEDVVAAKSKAQRAQETWQTIVGGDIPEEVVLFLRAAGQRDGAAFLLFTTVVRDWLTQHSLLASLKIRLS